MTAASLSEDTFVTVLLCGGLGARGETAAPLTTSEWNAVGRSLLRANLRPGDLLPLDATTTRQVIGDDEALAIRVGELLSRSVLVASEIERLAGAGITVMSRADEAYPGRLKSRLRAQCPPLLFHAGPVALLERGGIAAVGSRNVDEAGAMFARDVGAAAARARTIAISGAARGVDREAMFGALDAGGEAIGVMPDGLARVLRAPDVRSRIAEGSLLVISPHRPDARFEVWRAMGRNKVIYALADVSVVISSDAERGGTWTGARENLKHDWSPLFVRAGDDVPEGNRRLIELGGMPLMQEDLDASANGDFLITLLARAEQHSTSEHPRSVQQPLIDDAPYTSVLSRNSTESTNPADADGSIASAAHPGQLNLL